MPPTTIRGFLKELGMRIGAAAIALSMFFVVAWIKNSDIFGLGSVLESNTAYYSTVFVLLTIVAILYGMYGPDKPGL